MFSMTVVILEGTSFPIRSRKGLVIFFENERKNNRTRIKNIVITEIKKLCGKDRLSIQKRP
jgi:hypothetical protein